VKLNLKPKLQGHGRPGHLFGGRVRTSTAVLVIAFIALFWVHQTFQPESTASEAPPAQVVPPGFVPDPDYTWVPRTNVREQPRTTTSTPTPTTSPTETTTSPTTTSPTSPTTTVIDPDGPGPLAPQTVTPPPMPATTAPGGPGPAPRTPAPPG
jgi:hypothetical protein